MKAATSGSVNRVTEWDFFLFYCRQQILERPQAVRVMSAVMLTGCPIEVRHRTAFDVNGTLGVPDRTLSGKDQNLRSRYQYTMTQEADNKTVGDNQAL